MKYSLLHRTLSCLLLFFNTGAALAEVESLSSRLTSASYWERMEAFKEAASLPPGEQPKYLPLLMQGLNDPDFEFRLAASRALSGFGERARPAIPSIVAAFEIQNGEARAQLMDDIAKLGPLAVPALISALDASDAYVVWGACETLAKIGPHALGAIPFLEQLTDDSRPEVKHGAQDALLILRGVEASLPPNKALNTDAE